MTRVTDPLRPQTLLACIDCPTRAMQPADSPLPAVEYDDPASDAATAASRPESVAAAAARSLALARVACASGDTRPNQRSLITCVS